MADPLELRVEDQRLLRGCSAGLNQRTAVVVIGIDGVPDDGALLRIASGAAMLFPGDPLYGVRTSDWPSAFQVEPGQPGRTAEWMLGEWVIALTVALQRWARDPAWRGRAYQQKGRSKTAPLRFRTRRSDAGRRGQPASRW